MSTMSHNTNMLAIRAEKQFKNRVARCATMVGLSAADLLRAGLDRVIEEIETTGTLRCGRRKPAKKKGARP